jgi:hypothetical protein
MKRGVKASPRQALDEILDLCYSQTEGTRKVGVKVKRRSKE